MMPLFAERTCACFSAAPHPQPCQLSWACMPACRANQIQEVASIKRLIMGPLDIRSFFSKSKVPDAAQAKINMTSAKAGESNKENSYTVVDEIGEKVKFD